LGVARRIWSQQSMSTSGDSWEEVDVDMLQKLAILKSNRWCGEQTTARSRVMNGDGKTSLGHSYRHNGKVLTRPRESKTSRWCADDVTGTEKRPKPELLTPHDWGWEVILLQLWLADNVCRGARWNCSKTVTDDRVEKSDGHNIWDSQPIAEACLFTSRAEI
jgi:hypothetical protein